ncbi:hypothetical protein FE257_009490 [Aspergillus nanangensis]|uniref:Uncharacterized protein n=1 Tax=Aspergillus nanangensis TaxID=2582783 RepID=A0AAD4GU03_ASPNN|nr:hypothetical protein FE257_009490 [Aspergillus nanangensis]
MAPAYQTHVTVTKGGKAIFAAPKALGPKAKKAIKKKETNKKKLAAMELPIKALLVPQPNNDEIEEPGELFVLVTSALIGSVHAFDNAELALRKAHGLTVAKKELPLSRTVNMRISENLRLVIVKLKDWALSIKSDVFMQKDRRCNSPRGQSLVFKEQVVRSARDILSLPLIKDDARQGIYGNFPVGNLERKGDIGVDAY